MRTKGRLDTEMRTKSADVTLVPVPLSFTNFHVKRDYFDKTDRIRRDDFFKETASFGKHVFFNRCVKQLRLGSVRLRGTCST